MLAKERLLYKQYRQNRTFQNNEKKFYQQLGGGGTKTYQQPDAKETERFWTKREYWIHKQYYKRTKRTWNRPQNGNTHRLTQNNNEKIIKLENARPWCNTLLLVQEFTPIHGRLALEMNRCLQGAQVPEWMTKGKTILIQKDPSKGTALNNYRSITCLPTIWKILTAQYIDQHILNESKIRLKNLAMAWIDYKKAYDMVLQSWIIHCLKMYKI